MANKTSSFKSGLGVGSFFFYFIWLLIGSEQTELPLILIWLFGTIGFGAVLFLVSSHR